MLMPVISCVSITSVMSQGLMIGLVKESFSAYETWPEVGRDDFI